MRLRPKLSSLQYLSASISHFDTQKEASGAVISSVELLGPSCLRRPSQNRKAHGVSNSGYYMSYKFINLCRYWNMLKYLAAPRGYLSLWLPSKKLYLHHKCSVGTHSTCCSGTSRAKQATCISPHTCLSATADAAPAQKIVLSKHHVNYLVRRSSPNFDRKKTE